MKTSTYLTSSCVALLLGLAASIAAAEDPRRFVVGGGFALSGTNSKPVSHGHAYLVADKPGFVFGGVQDLGGKWKLNYLFLIKHNATSTSTFQRGDPDPTVSSGFSDGKIRRLHFKEELRFDQTNITLSYKATYDQARDERISEEMAIQGKEMKMSEGRIFVIDMTVNPVRCQQVNVQLPSSDDIDFIWA